MSTPPIVILCGFMATGKTTVGRALAEMLGVPFVDTDALVEARAGTSIAEIFAREGEARFRDLEAEVCAALSFPHDASGGASGAVIATGGGALLRDETFKRLQALGTLVLLEATLDEVLRRAATMGPRPMLASMDDAAAARTHAQRLHDERRPAYHRIDRRVDTTRRRAEEAAFEIAEQLRRAPDRGTVLHMRAGARPVPGRDPRPGEDGLTRIVVGRGTLARLGEWMRDSGLAGPAFVLVSRTVAGHHGAAAKAALEKAGLRNKFIEIDDSENAKTFEQAEGLLYELVDAGATRDGTVIALGGGVTGDVAGFVAATYMRGLPLVQVPTTLLAQVDSSIGGKVGVNHPRAKNLLGAVYQPQLVLSDVDVLATLPDREVSSGMAEVIKTAIVGSPELFARLEKAGKKVPLRDGAFLEECVTACARVKARVVEEDPYEQGPRRVLNLGHTVGHALEAALGYGVLTHGEAVAIGMLAALRLSVKRKLAAASFETTARRIIEACGLRTRVSEVGDDLLQAMSLDKKRRASGFSFVLPAAPGDVRIMDDVTEQEIVAAFNSTQKG
ncbi:MAG: 3-dehydroquinate synthase [Candidatus Latescibacteria bacterium]|nr:3-dehydroquinate synthase [Candidatus Latescibacterota bacterium]